MSGKRRTTAEEELFMVLATDLTHHLDKTYRDWIGANVQKTAGPGEVMLGLGLFLQETLGSLMMASGQTSAASERWAQEWWAHVLAGALERRTEGLTRQRASRHEDEEAPWRKS